MQKVESDKSAADWERRRALERCQVLEVAKNREAERALKAEGVASEKESELVMLRREIEGIKDRERSTADEYKRKWQAAVQDLEFTKDEKERLKETADKSILEANMKVEEVRSEVTRKVPELAAGALRKAEEEWRKRLAAEVEIARQERDDYILSAKASVGNLERSVNDFRRDAMESESLIKGLEDEVGKLRAENRKMANERKENNYGEDDERRGEYNRVNDNRRNPNESRMPETPINVSQGLYTSLQEVAASANMTMLQGQLGIMQAQCKMLLTEGVGTTPAALGINDLNSTRGSGVGVGGVGDDEIEKLFTSPVKGTRRNQSSHVSFKDDEFSNVSVDASFGLDAMTEESMNLTGGRNVSFGAPGSSKSGFMGNLWKARYGGGSKSPAMPR